MAEFCLDCWNRINKNTNTHQKKHIISKYLDLCEGCGEMKHVVLIEKSYHYIDWQKKTFLIFYILTFFIIAGELFVDCYIRQ